MKNIRQTVVIKASPHDVYETLIDSRKHSQLTGSKAEISRKNGGNFSVWDGDVNGVNLELVPDKKIVQSWRLDDWPENHFSKVTFKIEPDEKGTRIIFTQSAVPDEALDDVKQGWYEYYWNPMREMFK